MKDKEISLYMDWAERVSVMSYASRLKVGAVLVNGANVVYGYNGTPRGWDNVCELDGVTKDEVLHAEDNAILKCAEHGMSCSGATLFVTHQPCLKCAIKIIQSNIKTVYYKYQYRDLRGILALMKSNVNVFKYEVDNVYDSGCSVRQGSLF